ncbi:MAG: hypothetical protein V4501_00410 [Pseudomonadota bacterium]
MLSNNVTVTHSAADDASTINCLQNWLAVSNTTATHFLSQIHNNSTLSANTTNLLIQENLPKFMQYHLFLLQSGELLQHPHPMVYLVKTIYYLPYGFSAYSNGSSTADFSVSFTYEFLKFYENVLVNIINVKLEKLLFGLQDVKNQLGVSDVTLTFNLIRTMDEAAIAELTDYAYAAKARLIEDRLAGLNSTKFFLHNIKHIPESIQQVLLNPEGEVVTQFYTANEALKNILLLNTFERDEILKNIQAVEIANLPTLANILRKAAIIFRQFDGFAESCQTLKFTLMYGSPIQNFEEELDWARGKVRDVYAAKISRTAGKILSELLVTDKFINTVLQLPKLPLFNCNGNHTDYGNIARQEKNLNEAEQGFNVLAMGQPLPFINYSQPVDFNLLPAPSISVSSYFQPDLSTVGLSLGIAFTIGLCLYVTNSCCRMAGFWSKSLRSKKVKEEDVPTNEADHQPLLSKIMIHRATH